MFLYAFPARNSIKMQCEEGKKCYEVFSDTLLDISSRALNPLKSSLEGMHHYSASLNDTELANLVEKDDILGQFSKKITDRLIASSAPRVPLIMGIINMTPDSFYDGSRYLDRNSDEIVPLILNSDIVDIGGESTRPGAKHIPISEEIRRVVTAIKLVRETGNVPISIDTMHPETLEEVLKYEIQYINDITGFQDDRMARIARKEALKCIVMHMRGSPEDMMSHTRYDDLIGEVTYFLINQARKLIAEGIDPDSIILDPGIGFSKDFQSNLEIFRNIDSFKLGFKTLIGHSRKSYIGKIMENVAEDRLAATLSTSLYLYNHSIDIIRVHDPKENRYAIKTYDFLRMGSRSP